MATRGDQKQACRNYYPAHMPRNCCVPTELDSEAGHKECPSYEVLRIVH